MLTRLALQAQMRFFMERNLRCLQPCGERFPRFAVQVHAEMRYRNGFTVKAAALQRLALAGNMRDQVMAKKIEILIRSVGAAFRAPEHIAIEVPRFIEIAHRKSEVELRDRAHRRAQEAAANCGTQASKIFSQNKFQAVMLRS